MADQEYHRRLVILPCLHQYLPEKNFNLLPIDDILIWRCCSFPLPVSEEIPMFQFYPAILAAVISAGICSLPVITDDSSFTDSYPTPLPWSVTSATVGSIEIAFNMARAGDSTVTALLHLPSQQTWDAMSNQEKALYLLNRERYDRGIKPFEGYSADVSGVAQNYAQLLYNTGTFSHTEDGDPWERLNRVQAISANHDFFTYAENLAFKASSQAYTEEAVARAIYDWIYDDAGQNQWGHRNFCLATTLKDNSGRDGMEGLIGIGIVQGTNYTYMGADGLYSTIIVMDGFDPGSNWDHSSTGSTSLCSDKTDTIGRFQMHYDKQTVTDSQTGLMWMYRATANAEGTDLLADATNICNTSTFAGFSNWQLPNMAQSGAFHLGMNSEDKIPAQLFAGCTAEIVSDGYVRTRQGSIVYGLLPGDPINFSGGANVRCLRSP